MQQHYVSANYTHAPRDLAAAGVNVIAHRIHLRMQPLPQPFEAVQATVKEQGYLSRLSIGNAPESSLVRESELVVALGKHHALFPGRGALYVYADPESGITSSDGVTVITMPKQVSHFQATIVYTIPLQLLSWHVATMRGNDVDQPRNPAKSVTVE